MDIEKIQGEYLEWISAPSTEEEEEDGEFSTTFCDNHSDESDLRLLRLCRYSADGNDSPPPAYFWQEKRCLEGDLYTSAETCDPCQIFHVGQRNSFRRLRTTRALLEEFIQAYAVFPRIWDFFLPFSFRTQESDIGHAPIRFRQFGSPSSPDIGLGSFECAYGFRYVKRNGRSSMMRDDPDYDPWSVRQTAIYQQYNRAEDKIIFLLVAPSIEVRTKLQQGLMQSRMNGNRFNSFQLHLHILSTLHDNWRLYIRGLEGGLMKQSNRVTLAQVANDTVRLSPLTDFAVNFVDRQRLKVTEDKILDLVIMFESLYDTISRLHIQCRHHCIGVNCIDCCCSATLADFESLMDDIKLNLKKVDVLYKRAQSTAKLLSDLLDYENAQIGHLNEKSLNGLVKETKDENAKIMILTERSTQDAAAVKILTVITLIYLPMTVVASIFSSQLIRVSESGRISVVSGAWWFAAITIPLTLATLVAWRCWLSRTMMEHEIRMMPRSAQEPAENHESGGRLRFCYHLVDWRSIGRFVLSMRRRDRRKITEDCQGA